MSHAHKTRILLPFIALSACAVLDLEAPQSEVQVFIKPPPEFPKAELKRGREGWVLLHLAVDKAGLVKDGFVTDSSGSSEFEAAALEAIQHWRYPPGGIRELNVLVNFVFDEKLIDVSEPFLENYKEIHKYIDDGQLATARERLSQIRNSTDLTAFEWSYVLLTEGRIAGEYGDLSGQLESFRKAIVNEGRWLPTDSYSRCLRAIVLLEIAKGDYPSAVHDYYLLTDTPIGENLAAELKVMIQDAQARIANAETNSKPFEIADNSISVERINPKTHRYRKD
jgi:TonB family protein